MSKLVDRTFEILELFAEVQRPLTLTDISRRLKLPMSSCHNFIHAMEHRGYIYELAPRSGFYPTRRLQNLGNVIIDSDPIVMRADLLLSSLRDSLDESVQLAKASGLNAVFLLNFETSQPLRVQINVGENIRSIYSTSTGKALLGTLDDDVLSTTIGLLELAPFTSQTIVSKTALRKEIEEGRKKGFYTNKDETIEGMTSISVSFRWSSDVYIVTITGPSLRLRSKIDSMAPELISLCQRLENQH